MAKKEVLETKEARQDFAGIPESPIFHRDIPELPPNPILDMHVAGVRVGELPIEMQNRIVYRQTDEGIAEANEGRTGMGVEVDAPRRDRRWVAESSQGPGHWEEVIRSTDEIGKALHQRRDDVIDRGMSTYEARDPLKEVADRYVGKGMRPKFLSASKIKEGGGTGDYEVVKYPEGHARAGDPVKVKGLVLGQVPEQLAKARNRHYQEKGNMLLKQMTDQYKREGGQTSLSDQ
jgi:hypothetical protein